MCFLFRKLLVDTHSTGKTYEKQFLYLTSEPGGKNRLVNIRNCVTIQRESRRSELLLTTITAWWYHKFKLARKWLRCEIGKKGKPNFVINMTVVAYL